MTCRKCNHDKVKKFGCRKGIQRYRCNSCSAVFTDEQPRIGSHYIRQDEAEKALIMMLEGMSLRAISRITGLHVGTILSLMVTASQNAQKVFDKMVRNIRPKFVQLDELWCMVGCHGKRVTIESPADWGDQWTWVALDSDSKMILTHYIGPRNTVSAYKFVKDLSERTLGTYQITSDALRGYIGAIEEWYGSDVHYAQLRKIYSRSEAGPEWYAGGAVVAAVPVVKPGNPEWSRISTSHIERANLSVRMHIRRYARNQCDQQKVAYAESCCCSVYCVVQLLPCASDAKSYSRHASGDYRSYLEPCRASECSIRFLIMSEQVKVDATTGITHIPISGHAFSGIAVSMDNGRFVNCRFSNCELVYSGGPFLVQDCKFDNCRWKMQMAAALTIDSLARCGFQIQFPGNSWKVGEPK